MHEQYFLKIQRTKSMIQRYLTEENLNLDGLYCFNLGLSSLLVYGTINNLFRAINSKQFIALL